MFLSLLAYVIIPIYTLFFVQGSNWFTTNFSVIGNTLERREEFVLWGLIVGAYFFWCLYTITKRMPRKPRGTFLLPLAVVLLTFALTTPYLPEKFPFQSLLHVVFAFVAAICLMVCLCLIVWRLYEREPKVYGRYLAALLAIALFSGILLVVAGIVSSALELFFTISTTILTRRLVYRVAERTSSDAVL